MKTFQVIRSGIVFELQPEAEGGYTITVPSLPGCISYGETFKKAMEMIKDAMEGWLAVAREEGIPVPEQFETIEVASFRLPRLICKSTSLSLTLSPSKVGLLH